MAKKIFTYLLLMAVVGPMWADDLQTLFDQGNKAYEAQDFETAVNKYESIISQGFESADLYFNLGNAHYRLEHIAPAILHFEKALVLQPGHKDAHFNLRMAKLRVVDNIDPVPELMFVGWLRNIFLALSPAQWASFSLLLLLIAGGAGAAFLLGKTTGIKRIGFFGAIALAVLSLIALGLSLGRKQVQKSTQKGIIMAQTTQVKNAPGGDQDLSILHEGVKVNILEESGDWTRISIHGVGLELEGFVKREQIEKI